MHFQRSNAALKPAPVARRELRSGASEWRMEAIKARASNDDWVLPVPGEDGPQSGSPLGRRVCFGMVCVATAVVIGLRMAGLIA